MPLFKRPARDPHRARLLRAFEPVADAIDAAQRSLLAAIPTSRDPGIPLGQALAAFSEHLARATDAMPAWRDDATMHEWTSCSDAVSAARAEAERLRLEPATLGFEALNARVGDVLHHLEVFADAERALRRR